MPASDSRLPTRRSTAPSNWLPLVSLAFTVLLLIGFVFVLIVILKGG
jgi:hypothetical protein